MKQLNKKRVVFVLGLMFALVMSIAACSPAPQETENEAPKPNPNVMEDKDINSLTIQDNDAIYKDDDDLSVVTMYLTVSQGNAMDNTNHLWSDVNSHSVFYYGDLGIERMRAEGMLQVGDEKGPKAGEFGYGAVSPNATVQIRGKTSSRSPQKSYKVELKKNKGKWRLQSTIPLNKHVYDSVRFRNKLSYDLMKTIPNIMSARTQFVHLYVKDLTTNSKTAKFENYGLYTQVEQINKTYLRNHGLDENGQLYKAEMFEFTRYPDEIKLTSDTGYDKVAFEKRLEIKGSDDHTKLIKMLDDLNNLSMPIEEVFPKYFDEENYFTWLAFQMITGNTDTSSQNFYLYSPQNGNKWYFIPWDNDGAWQFGENLLFDGVKGYNFKFGVSNYWGSMLHQRVLKSAEYRKKLDDKVNEMRSILTKDKLKTLVSGYSAITRKYLYAMPDKMYATQTEKEFDQILETIPKEIDSNYEMYLTSLRRPCPFYLAVPEYLGDKMLFQWDASYDFSGEDITYSFELSRDYKMQTVIKKQENLAIPQMLVPKLPPGQYFYRVNARNKSGETQTAMEIYEAADDQKYFGTLSFYVMPDGSIQGA